MSDETLTLLSVLVCLLSGEKQKMESYQLAVLTCIFVAAGLTLAKAVANEEFLDISEADQYRLIPDKKAGARSVRTPDPDALCRDCIIKSRDGHDRFQQYVYLNFYDQNPNITNSDELAGIKTCRELKEVNDCYELCLSTITVDEKQAVRRSFDYRSIMSVKTLYCEERYTPGHTSCRIADAHRCDKIRRSGCRDTLTEHADCISSSLAKSGQDCSGHCTPARRFLQSQKFMWDTECQLKATFKSQCKDIVTIFCFNDVKDSDANYGIYQRMDTIPYMANNLTHACGILESPFPCMETATNGFYDYFGFNLTYACRGAEDVMESIKQEWQSIIDPFCSPDIQDEYTSIADVCPPPDPALLPTESIKTTTTAAITTKKKFEIYEPKAGHCPANDVATPCDTVCADDSHCAGSYKCCESCCRQPQFRRNNSRPRFVDGSSSNSKPGSRDSSKGGSAPLLQSGVINVLLMVLASNFLLCF